MNRHPILYMILLLYTATADQLTTIAKVADYPAGKLQKITLFQPVTYAHKLVNQDVWTQYPGLTITFTVPFAQYVYVKYHIVIPSTNNYNFVTRLMVDGTQDWQFRVITGSTNYHSNIVAQQIFMEAGKHTVAVHYRNNCVDWPIITISDWNAIFISAKFYSQAK